MSKRIYLASPFFDEFELDCVRRAEDILTKRGFELFSPRLNEVERDKAEEPGFWSAETFENDRRNIDLSDVVVMLYHGGYSDSGTAWECGYAYAKGLPVVVVHVREDADSNLMVSQGCRANVTLEELESYDFDGLPKKSFGGKIF